MWKHSPTVVDIPASVPWDFGFGPLATCSRYLTVVFSRSLRHDLGRRAPYPAAFFLKIYSIFEIHRVFTIEFPIPEKYLWMEEEKTTATMRWRLEACIRELTPDCVPSVGDRGPWQATREVPLPRQHGTVKTLPATLMRDSVDSPCCRVGRGSDKRGQGCFRVPSAVVRHSHCFLRMKRTSLEPGAWSLEHWAGFAQATRQKEPEAHPRSSP